MPCFFTEKSCAQPSGGVGLGLSSLGEGKYTIVFNFKYDGPGPGKGGTGVLSVDGNEVARKSMAHTIPMLMPFDETFDVGLDTRTQGGFYLRRLIPLHGSIDKLTYNIGPTQLLTKDQKKVDNAIAQVNISDG